MQQTRSTARYLGTFGIALGIILGTGNTGLAAPPDSRLGALRNLDGYFPFKKVGSAEEWEKRKEDLVMRVRVATGLWPMPSKADLNPVIHGRVERDGYTIDRVYFESLPGHYVTGSLYLPKGAGEGGKKIPAVLSPHGHWANGRFYEVADANARKRDIESGAEKFDSGAYSPLQARCVQLARMGCAVFHYDMLNYADSIQVPHHRPWEREGSVGTEVGDWAFSSDQAAAHLQTSFGLQTWNSVRAVDFVLTLDFVDPERIAVTGASGGATQTMMLAAVDERIAAAFPAVMVSTSMQGGCTCENGHYLRIGCGNIDIAALVAPRPLGLTAADDWTVELETKGYPDLKGLYEMLGVPERFTAGFYTEFKHNFNHVSRDLMYGFMNRHLELGLKEPVEEGEFEPLTREEMTVWTDAHPAPSGEEIGDAHERAVLRWMTEDAERWLAVFGEKEGKGDFERSREIIAGGISIMIGRALPEADEVTSELVSKEDRGDYLEMESLVRYAPAGEAVPGLFFYPKEWNQKVVIWVTGEGMNSLRGAEGKPRAEVLKFLDAGYAVGAPDLFMQGSFLDGADPPKENRRANSKATPEKLWLNYSGFTYGYNDPLFSQRVHDVLSLIALAKHDTVHPVKEICLLGVEGGGKWAAAARAVAGDVVGRAAIDPGGFRFGGGQSQWDADFLPGCLKYGGLSGMLLAGAPGRLWISTDSSDFGWMGRAYENLGKADDLDVAETAEGDLENVGKAVEWMIGR